MQKSDYVKILVESLEKKVALLDQIRDKNIEQRIILSEEKVSSDRFEANLEGKSRLIEELNGLDDGFEEVYNRVREEINQNREQYKDEIINMQKLITTITETSNTIKVQEQRNRDLAEKQFSFVKERARKVQAGAKAATQYYQTMSNAGYNSSQFIDNKK